jgi:hypothetical protein
MHALHPDSCSLVSKAGTVAASNIGGMHNMKQTGREVHGQLTKASCQ